MSRKILALFLAFSYFTSAVGMPATFHLCHGEVKAVHSFFAEEDDCHATEESSCVVICSQEEKVAEEEFSRKCCEIPIAADDFAGCCDDQQLLVNADLDSHVSSSHEETVQQQVSWSSPSPALALQVGLEYFVQPQVYQKSERDQPLFIKYCSFLFYG